MSSGTIATPPSVSWAQRSTRVFLTFNVECEKPDFKINNRKVYFKGLCAPDQKLHEIEIQLYGEIDPEKSTHTNKGRLIEVVLTKLKSDDPFWPSLTSDKKKHHWLKIDFERWQDEDESGDDVDDMNAYPFNLPDEVNGFVDHDEKDLSSSEEEEDLTDIE